MSSTSAPARKGADWLPAWDPENDWESSRAWKTLWVTTGNLTLAFATWFLVSAIAPKLTSIGFDLSKNQLYWLAAMPGLAGGTLRLIWTFLPPIMGTRKLVTVTTALLVLPLIGWGLAVQNPSTPYGVLLFLGALVGLGGGAFSGFMPSTSYFFPRAKQGTALGLQAGIGNFGVSLVQLVTPWIIGFAMVGTGQVMTNKDTGATNDVWFQNAAYVWIPFVVGGTVLAWVLLRSVPVQARGVRDQLDIFSNKHTWIMTYLYVITFGTFSGMAAQLSATKGPAPRRLWSCSERATSSLPVPLSPWMRMAASLPATRSSSSKSRRMRTPPPTIEPKRPLGFANDRSRFTSLCSAR